MKWFAIHPAYTFPTGADNAPDGILGTDAAPVSQLDAGIPKVQGFPRTGSSGSDVIAPVARSRRHHPHQGEHRAGAGVAVRPDRRQRPLTALAKRVRQPAEQDAAGLKRRSDPGRPGSGSAARSPRPLSR